MVKIKDIDIVKAQYNIKDFCDLQGIKYKKEGKDLIVESPYNAGQKSWSLHIQGHDYTFFKDFSDASYSATKQNYGDILNFTEYYYNLDTKNAINLLKQTFNINNKDYIDLDKLKKQNTNNYSTNNKETYHEIENVRDIKNNIIKNYLQNERKIDLDTAKKAEIKEIYYSHKQTGKKYFGIAFKNDNGGFEVREARSGGLKLSIGNKDITSFVNQNSNTINVFEGFMDYASAIKLSEDKILNQTNIILNSTSNKEKALKVINEELKNAKKVKLFLDNDNAGDNTTKFFMDNIKDKEIEDMRNYYYKFNDLNDYLVDKVNKKEKMKNAIDTKNLKQNSTVKPRIR
jgi:hypothetical protein